MATQGRGWKPLAVAASLPGLCSAGPATGVSGEANLRAHMGARQGCTRGSRECLQENGWILEAAKAAAFPKLGCWVGSGLGQLVGVGGSGLEEGSAQKVIGVQASAKTTFGFWGAISPHCTNQREPI